MGFYQEKKQVTVTPIPVWIHFMKLDREMLQLEGNHVKACMEMQKLKINDKLKIN